MNFFNNKSTNFGTNIYLKKLGFVSKGNLNISVENKELCNIRVDELSEKFNNSISIHF